MTHLRARLFVAIQAVLPQHQLSRMVGKLAESRRPSLKNALIRLFIRIFKVDMGEALEPNPRVYGSFNDFFVRELKPGARPLAAGKNTVLCPADGHISQQGQVLDGRLLQAKGRDFSLRAMLGGDVGMAETFSGGSFATVYLSPRDYHRVHMPLNGELRRMLHVPGRLFSVNTATTGMVDELFARNERVINLFETEKGPMAVVLVGAMICASIETHWAGLVAPAQAAASQHHYKTGQVPLARGEELGRFKLGSTVIVLFPARSVGWREDLQADTRVRMGEALGRWE